MIVMISNARFWQVILAFILLALPLFLITGSYIVSDSPAPLEGMEENPFPDQPLSEGLLFVVIDGGRRDMRATQL